MSMEYYPIHDRYAFYVDDECLAYTAIAAVQQGKCSHIPSFFPDLRNLSVKEVIKHLENGDLDKYDLFSIAADLVKSFEYEPLEYASITTEAPFWQYTASPFSCTIIEDEIIFIGTAKQPAMFGTAPYNTPDELLDEFKAHFRVADVPLPATFDFASHIVSVDAVYYG